MSIKIETCEPSNSRFGRVVRLAGGVEDVEYEHGEAGVNQLIVEFGRRCDESSGVGA